MVNKADSACLIENNAIPCIIRNKVNNCANNGTRVLSAIMFSAVTLRLALNARVSWIKMT
jgi:hypothetical protein